MKLRKETKLLVELIFAIRHRRPAYERLALGNVSGIVDVSCLEDRRQDEPFYLGIYPVCR